MGRIGWRDALRAMNTAHEAGVTHFDTARSYGFGRAESVLGAFVRGKRDKITITTKFGVVPPALTLKLRLGIPVARHISRWIPNSRAVARKRAGVLLSEKRFDGTYLTQCLELSLRELSTDFVDILLLHDPAPMESERSSEIVRVLEKHVAAGKLRRWGISYMPGSDHLWGEAIGPNIIQFEGNIDNLQSGLTLAGNSRQRIVTRPFIGGASLRHERSHLADNTGTVASLGLARYLAGQSGSVICSMFSREHIRENVQVMESLIRINKLDSIVKPILERALLLATEDVRE